MKVKVEVKRGVAGKQSGSGQVLAGSKKLGVGVGCQGGVWDFCEAGMVGGAKRKGQFWKGDRYKCIIDVWRHDGGKLYNDISKVKDFKYRSVH